MTRINIHYRRRVKRGFVHMLLLVFAILGITLWGASEVQQWAEESKQNVSKTSNTALFSAKQALFNYALFPPEKLESKVLPGRYNAYDEGTADPKYPFRYFSLPCPDVALDVAIGGDENLDGASDILANSCGDAPFVDALNSGSRFGRLPWREERDVIGGEVNYIRGLGDDFRDGYGERLWYSVSRNIIASDTPLSPHSLLRMTTGWMTAVNEDNEIISDRVAAFIIAPGLYGGGDSGGRIAEDFLYGGAGVAPATVSGDLYKSYLDEETYAGFIGSGGETITIRTNLNDASVDATSPVHQRNNADSTDKIEYITVDELVADGFNGINMLEKAQENIYDIAEGKGAFLGVQELLESHLNRYGFLPEPAVFDEGVINQRSRPSGAPAQTTIIASYSYETFTLGATATVTTIVNRDLSFQQGARTSASRSLTVAIRLSDLPPVFLVDGARLRAIEDRASIPIPYGAGLAALETALNTIPLSDAVTLDLKTSDHYPDQGIAGLGATVLVSARFAPFPTSPVVELTGPMNLNLRAGSEFPVVLADNGYGYFVDETLISLVSYPNGKSTVDIAQLPPGALKVLLPAGTRLTLRSDNIVVRLPAEFTLPPDSVYDPVSGEWVLNSGSDAALEIFANDDRWITVSNLPGGLPVVAGDMGLLPVEEAVVEADAVGSMVELTSDKNSISRIAVDTVLYTDSNLLIVPFAPFGRPVFDEGNQNQESLVTPFQINSGKRFQVPPGSRVIYPKNGTFNTGDTFIFPDDSILQFSPGAVIEVQAFSLAVLPGGQQLKNTSNVDVLITLVHGGLVNLKGVRIDAVGSEILSSAQKLFDVELRGINKVAGNDVDSGTILRPFINQRMIPPPARSININTTVVFSSENYIRAGFLTRPRNARVPLAVGDNSLIESPYNASVVFDHLRGIYDVDKIAALSYQGVSNPTVMIEFDEDTQFLIPPGRGVSLTLSAFTIDGVLMTVMRSVQLPRGTGIFDIDSSPALYDLSLDIASPIPRIPQLVVTGEDIEVELIQETATHVFENRLVLYPETDMYMFIGGSVSLVAAGSIVDLLEGVIYSQVGVQKINRVAEDLGVRSSGEANIYFNEAVTLITDRGDWNIARDSSNSLTVITEPAPQFVAMHYVSYADYITVGAVTTAFASVTLIRLPSNSYISIPPGRDIDFLSNKIGDSSDINLADYEHLPQGAVAIILPGKEMVMDAISLSIDSTTITTTSSATPPVTTTMTTYTTMTVPIPPITVAGPAYVNLSDSNGAVALVNVSTHLSGEPLVFLREDAYLKQTHYEVSDGSDKKIYAPIPPDTTLLDLYGNMEQRADSGFYSNLMPTDSRQFFEDFPIFYAVAPECRLTKAIPGPDCAEGAEEGLNFELKQGEEYLLEEELNIPFAALITSAYPNVSLTVQVFDIGSTAVRDSYNDVAAILINSLSGEVEMSVGSGSYTYKPNDKIVVRVNGNNRQTELRAYMDSRITILNTPATTLAAMTYAALDGELTIYSGGYIGDDLLAAEGVATLLVSTTIAYGYGAKLSHINAGEKFFGNETFASLSFVNNGAGYTNRINLEDYVFNGDGAIDISVSLSANAADVDIFGESYIEKAVGDDQIVEDSNAQISVAISIQIAPNAKITMESGYLWQGYVPTRAEWEVSQNTVIISSYVREYENAYRAYASEAWVANQIEANELEARTVVTRVFPDNQIHVRIQSTVSELNGWGSGKERPEAIDSRSLNEVQRDYRPYLNYLTLTAAPDTYGDPYYSFGAFRSFRTDNTGYTEFSSGIDTTTVLPIPNDFGRMQAVHSFAELMDATRTGTDYESYSSTRNRTHLTLRAKVHNTSTGAVTAVTVHWQPILITVSLGVTVTVMGVVRVNNASNSPLPNSAANAGSTTDEWVNWVSTPTLLIKPLEQDILMLSWVGRNNSTADPEDGFIDGFSCNGNPATAVFNMPHTDQHGNAAKPGTWNIVETQAALINESPAAVLPLVSGGNTYTAFNVTTARPTWVTIARPTAYYVPISISIVVAGGTTEQTLTVSTSAEIAATQTVLLTTHMDWVFYMDPSYHPDRGAGYPYSEVPANVLEFGDDFRISGPAAIVPPFAGANEQATREIYGERSRLMTELIPGMPTLSHVYDDQTGDCRVQNDCDAAYHGADWFPIVGGILTFEGLQVNFTPPNDPINNGADDLQIVMPQPEALVETAGGNIVTLYSGAIIYPKASTPYAINATPIPTGNYQLISYEDIVAHVDVSPVRRNINRQVRTHHPFNLDGGIFNYTPVVASDPDCIVEPLGFTTPGPLFDFDPRSIARKNSEADAAEWNFTSSYTATSLPEADHDSPLCSILGTDNVSEFGCAVKTLVDHSSANPFFFRTGILLLRDFDDDVYKGHRAFGNAVPSLNITRNNLTPPSNTAFRGHSTSPLRIDESYNRGFIADDDGLALLTAYHSGATDFTSPLFTTGSRAVQIGGAAAPAAASIALPDRNTDVNFINPAAYYWKKAGTHFIPLGVENINVTDYTSYAFNQVGVRLATDAEEFDSLRLLHNISIPRTSRIPLKSYGYNSYPSQASSFFTFPAGSEAVVVNNDMGSWLAANPYLGLYQQNAEIDLFNVGGGGATTTVTATIPAENDSYSRVNLAGKHVVHYLRSEASEHDEPNSNVPIYTNVWLRLPTGGRLFDPDSGHVIELSPNSVVNPIMGTYFQSIEPSRVIGESLTNQYQTQAYITNPLHLVRPALTIPVGARIVVGENGGIIRNVKAAAIFSLTPLEAIQCPTGIFDGYSGQYSEQNGTPVVFLNQKREGISENNYDDVATGRKFGFSHPCAWLDDPENTDGDRYYVYRNRRRYGSELKVQTTSNDRTYLLGGQLELR